MSAIKGSSISYSHTLLLLDARKKENKEKEEENGMYTIRLFHSLLAQP